MFHAVFAENGMLFVLLSFAEINHCLMLISYFLHCDHGEFCFAFDII